MTEFEKIYRACFADVYRYLTTLTHNASLAEELTSETFFRAMRALDSFRGDCEVRVWLCGIAKNCYYSHLKKQKRHMPDAAEEAAAAEDDVEKHVEDKEDARQIHRLLHELPEPYKEVFMLRTYGELSFREIGDLFAKTENWACVTYHRARMKIRQKMGEGEHEK